MFSLFRVIPNFLLQNLCLLFITSVIWKIECSNWLKDFSLCRAEYCLLSLASFEYSPARYLCFMRIQTSSLSSSTSRLVIRLISWEACRYSALLSLRPMPPFLPISSECCTLTLAVVWRELCMLCVGLCLLCDMCHVLIARKLCPGVYSFSFSNMLCCV